MALATELVGMYDNGLRNYLRRAPPNSVLYLPGLGAGGSTITDYSGNGNDGTIVGPTWLRLPSGLYVLNYDIAHDDYVSVDDNPDWNIGAGDFTISFWAQHSELGVLHTYISQYVDANYYWFVRKEVGDTVSLVYKNGDNTTANRITVTTSSTLSANIPYFLTVRRTGTVWSIHFNGNPTPETSVDQVVSNSDFASILGIGTFPTLGFSIYGYIGLVSFTKAYTDLSRYQRERHFFGV